MLIIPIILMILMILTKLIILIILIMLIIPIIPIRESAVFVGGRGRTWTRCTSPGWAGAEL